MYAFLLFYSGERLRQSLGIERTSEHASCSAYFDVGCLEVGCIDGIVVVVVFVIVSYAFVDNVVVGCIISKPCCTKMCFVRLMTRSLKCFHRDSI